MSHQVRAHRRAADRREDRHRPPAPAPPTPTPPSVNATAFERRVLSRTAANRPTRPPTPTDTPGTRRTPHPEEERLDAGEEPRAGEKARSLWRRHKARAVAHGLLALGWAGGHAARPRGAARTRKTWQKWGEEEEDAMSKATALTLLWRWHTGRGTQWPVQRQRDVDHAVPRCPARPDSDGARRPLASHAQDAPRRDPQRDHPLLLMIAWGLSAAFWVTVILLAAVATAGLLVSRGGVGRILHLAA